MKEIELTKGYKAKIDDEDFEYLSQFNWRVKIGKHTKYAYRHKPCTQGSYIIMHREITNAPDGLVVDHLDGDGLNNQRSNLVVCSQSVNIQRSKYKNPNQSSKYRGVTKRVQTAKRKLLGHNDPAGYQAAITVNQRRIHLGTFKTEEEAAIAYNQAAINFFGHNAKLNII